MKVKAYGNLINRVAETDKAQTPKVGEGATLMLYSDRHPYTIIAVHHKGKKLWATLDKATRTDKLGMSDMQDYTYETVVDAAPVLFTLRKDGRWHKGATLQGPVLNVGYRDKYHDFSF